MTEREAFIAAIAAQPDEDTPRLAFADWLQENGEDDRARFVRLACEIAALRAELRHPLWPLPDDLREQLSVPNELFDLRGAFWLDEFFRALGCDETATDERARGWAGRLWERVAGEPRVARHYLEYTGGDESHLRVDGNVPVWELGLRRGFVEHLTVNLSSPFAIPDLAAAFRLEPVHRLTLRLFGARPNQWPSVDVASLARVSYLSLQLPAHSRRTSAAFADLAHGENWSGLRELHAWSPSADGFAVPHGYVHQLANAPLLAGLRSLMIEIVPADLPLLTSSPLARNLRSLGVSWPRLPADACAALAGATFRPNLEALYLSLAAPGDAGVRRLASAAWPKLQTLHLSGGITDAGVRDLLPLVRQLTDLNLASGEITDTGARLLADALDAERLVSLNLCDNPLSPEVGAELRERFGGRFYFRSRHDGAELQQFP